MGFPFRNCCALKNLVKIKFQWEGKAGMALDSRGTCHGVVVCHNEENLKHGEWFQKCEASRGQISGRERQRLLGTAPDHIIARKVGRHAGTVEGKRSKRGIPSQWPRRQTTGR